VAAFDPNSSSARRIYQIVHLWHSGGLYRNLMFQYPELLSVTGRLRIEIHMLYAFENIDQPNY
jgi:hypothetical protein